MLDAVALKAFFIIRFSQVKLGILIFDFDVFITSALLCVATMSPVFKNEPLDLLSTIFFSVSTFPEFDAICAVAVACHITNPTTSSVTPNKQASRCLKGIFVIK